MKKITLLPLLMMSAMIVCAQKSVERVEIQGGSQARDNFYREVYRYPNFTTGIVEYKNGKQYRGSLNYNKAIGTIEFIDEKADTLALSEEASIKEVHIGDDVFFYANEDCMELLMDGKNFRLVKNERIRIADKKKVGGYGISNSTGTIDSYDRIDTKLTYNQVDINEKLLLNKTTRYFLENENGELIPASKKNILNLFPRHQQAINEYVKAHNIDFSEQVDLTELAGFLAQL